jgi:hypothetical protein
VADKEDGAMAWDRVEATRGDAVLDRAGAYADRTELRTGDDTSLPCGELRNALVDMTRVSFGLHVSL